MHAHPHDRDQQVGRQIRTINEADLTGRQIG
jgi:hypothetical protein